MSKTRRLTLAGAAAFALVLIGATGYRIASRLRIEPLPSAEQIRKAKEQRYAECAAKLHRDLPSLRNLPSVEAMKTEQALILESIGGLHPAQEGTERTEWRGAAKPHAPVGDVSGEPRFSIVDHHLQYGPRLADPKVMVSVTQWPTEEWPRYYAKYPHPSLSAECPDTTVMAAAKFGNGVQTAHVYDRVEFFWPSGKNFVHILYLSDTINEEVVRRYLQKFPSSP